MKINKLEDMYVALRQREEKPRLVVAYGVDSHSILAAYKAVTMGIVRAILVGDEKEIRRVCKEEGVDVERFAILNEADEIQATRMAVGLVRQGEGDVIMKGSVSTDKYMRAILNKEEGLVNPNTILSHVTVMECKNYHKLLILSDVAVIPSPDLNQKVAMIKYVTLTAKALGVACPKVALVTPTEQVLPKVQSTIDAAILTKMAERGQICPSVVVDGPMGLDVALEAESAKIKHINSPVAGDADCLIFPNLESGNVFYKANTKLAGSQLGAILVGARVPSVLSSRGDTMETKCFSIALAALLA